MSNNKTQQTLQIGTVIQEKWVILEFLGKGGMGEVYRAHQVNLKRDIAVKIISMEWLASLEDNREEIETGLQRFRNEVLAMAQVRHPNILQIYDYGSFSFERGGEPLSMEYIAMEYVPGGTLRFTMSEEGYYPEEELVRDWVMKYFSPVLDGVQALHDAGIIHRDMKPENVLMDGSTPKISDFGLARSSRIRPVTTSMDMKGTPPYMSPEHFMDLKRVDNRADIYSLGKILYEAIDGKMGPGTIPLKSAGLEKTATPFFEKMDRIIRKATAEDRNSRFESVAAFQAALLDAVKPETADRKDGQLLQAGRSAVLSHPKAIWAGVALATLLVLGMILWHLFGEPGKAALEPNRPPAASNGQVLSPEASPPRQSPGPALGSSPSVMTGRDGATLHLVPGGEFLLPPRPGEETGRSLGIGSFFMDETEVTNHQYVEFLNRVLSEIRVEGEAVKSGENLWFVLGEVEKGYEPILLKNGKFAVKDPLYHSHPVVRVTAYGAGAYAQYYGRRLPTAWEWLYALKSGKGADGSSPEAPSDEALRNHMEMMREQVQGPSKMPVSVTDSEPDKNGIRGLQGNVDEWGVAPPDGSAQAAKGTLYVVLPESVSRGAWEAFQNVGFRTVVSVSNRK